ncbi:tubby C-terminal domain-like protein [Alkalibacillus silvisoli]|uniref:Tubby C-terminal domain-containing protein n=1 Tax=Alkalibacillus silvisoli TaxID=392823 RepID=A0ABN0ZQF5_9BACI
MSNYKLSIPIRFTKECQLYDKNNNVLFTINGFHRRIFERLLYLIRLQINLKGTDNNGTFVRVIHKPFKESGFKGKWDVFIYNFDKEVAHYSIINNTKIKTEMNMEYHKGNSIIKMTSSTLDKKLYFQELQSSKVVATGDMPRIYLKQLDYEILDNSFIESWEVPLLYYLFLSWK